MISSTILSRAVLAAVATLLAASLPARAQSYEEQARTILSLYESGNKDTAYTLIEPLKSSARFVPAVIYTRAQMTPDDRALGLYKELIALDPGGDYADDAAYQLVRRYVEKSDSLAAITWLGALKKAHPTSSLVFTADKLVQSAFLAGRAKTKSSKQSPQLASREAVAEDAPSGDAVRGYALQVGLFPTRESALVRAGELKQKGIRAMPLPKSVNGERNYALVVGPYESIDAANARKQVVVEACDCQAFIVKVE